MKIKSKTTRWGLSLAVVLLLMAILAIPVEAARAIWSTETILDPNSDYTYPRTAVNTIGTSVAVWDQLNASGLNQVVAAVRTIRGWTATTVISDPTVDSINVGAVVTAKNKVTVFFVVGGIGGSVYESTYSNNAWSAPQAVPAGTGYTFFGGAGTDSLGNIEIIMGSPQAIAGTTAYNLQSLVKSTSGVWSAPVQINSPSAPVGIPHFTMLPNGKSLLVAGMYSFRSSKLNTWVAPEIIPITGYGQIFSTDAAFDAGGNGYFVFRTHYSGAFLIVWPAAATTWGKAVSVPQFDTLGSDLAIVASSRGHAMIYGLDYLTGEVNVSVTTNQGGMWSPMTSLGPAWYAPKAVGSTNGMYVIYWNNGDFFNVAVGTGAGTAASAWLVTPIADNSADGTAAIAGNKVVSAWWRYTDPTWMSVLTGAKTGIVGP